MYKPTNFPINKSLKALESLLINIFNNIRSMYPLQHRNMFDYCDEDCIGLANLL